MKPVLMLLAAASLALPITACSAPPTSAGPDRPATSAVAYSACMRSHDVPAFPDPATTGTIPKTTAQQLGVSDQRLQSAQRTCQHLLPVPNTSQQQAQQCLQAGVCPPPLVQQMLTADRHFAQCMRAHGVPTWPDPTIDTEGRPVFNLVPTGITHHQTHSPPISTKLAECGRLTPASAAMESN